MEINVKQGGCFQFWAWLGEKLERWTVRKTFLSVSSKTSHLCLFPVCQRSGCKTQLKPTEAKERGLLGKRRGKVGPPPTWKASPFLPSARAE